MLRELDQRADAGLIVTLEWDSDAEHVRVRYEDENAPGRPAVCYVVEPWNARLAFLYPVTFEEVCLQAESLGDLDIAVGSVAAGEVGRRRPWRRRRAADAGRDILAFTWWASGLVVLLALLAVR